MTFQGEVGLFWSDIVLYVSLDYLQAEINSLRKPCIQVEISSGINQNTLPTYLTYLPEQDRCRYWRYRYLGEGWVYSVSQ
jgi:hypothetical protein